MNLKNRNISQSEVNKSARKIKENLEYLDSRSQALLLSTKPSSRVLIWLSFLFFILLIIWTYVAEIDQLIRGMGKVIPSGKIQTVQNLEGGIVSKLLVQEGSKVEEGMVLLELDKRNFESKKEENQLKIEALQSKVKRLEAESKRGKFRVGETEKEKQEYRLYLANKKLLNQEVDILNKQLFQKRNALQELRAKKKNLQKSLKLTREEVEMKRELLAQLVGSKNELNLAEQKLSGVEGEFEATSLAIPRLVAAIEEVQTEIKQTYAAFQTKSTEELTLAKDELLRVKQSNISKKDRVTRATVRSPVKGVVQRLFHNTVGGVVKAGEPIMEIVPSNDLLIISAKIRPADIAFIHLNQEAIVRFTAYDFSVYGSLEGNVVHISADTIVDEVDKKSYYKVQIKTKKNYLGKEKHSLKLMVGMVATIDIVGEKQRVLDYILKPVLRAGKNILSER
ncbi:MAG: Type I secretion system, membrane fusion protein LapC [uncultured Sulfurovum sp.]|uniref:Type I secretion system, membrane fusion protein LapC n=1 Tax=uncultured Sulfurovum sp. TaxID=269237 RepID=A0A6S6U7K0_9BACT|nr:MAG: Type I secretion system, membrane fusion protein LapC [uncultured Sulfurovum sp.]